MHPALQQSMASRFAFVCSRIHPLLRSSMICLSPFALWTAFPSADYYGDSVPLGFSPFRESRGPHELPVLAPFRFPTHPLHPADGSRQSERSCSPGGHPVRGSLLFGVVFGKGWGG